MEEPNWANRRQSPSQIADPYCSAEKLSFEVRICRNCWQSAMEQEEEPEARVMERVSN